MGFFIFGAGCLILFNELFLSTKNKAAHIEHFKKEQQVAQKPSSTETRQVKVEESHIHT